MERGHGGRLRGEGGGWAGEREGRLEGSKPTPDRGRRETFTNGRTFLKQMKTFLQLH